jgi:hypothetical protein
MVSYVALVYLHRIVIVNVICLSPSHCYCERDNSTGAAGPLPISIIYIENIKMGG